MVCSEGDVYEKLLRLYFGYICGDLCLLSLFQYILFFCLVHTFDSMISNDQCLL